MKPGHAFFDTALGRCAIAWTARGVAGFALPGAGPDDIEAFPPECRAAAKPPAAIAAAMRRAARHLAGTPDPLEDVALDLTGVTGLRRALYEALRRVPPGQTVTYGELARRAGAPKAARAAGRAMAANPVGLFIPCHRVLAAGNRLGGFRGTAGLPLKRRLLSLEGATWIENGEAAGGGRRPAARPRNAGAPGEPDDGHAAAVRRLRRADPGLARAIDLVGPCRLAVDSVSSVYHALLESIVYQQLTGKAAATIFGRLKDRLAGGGEIEPRHVAGAPDDLLRGAGLSRAKVAACRDLTARALSGGIPSPQELARMSDEEVVERLTAVRGIGRWTVQMLLIFRLGRPDVLAVDDYGLRKGFMATFGTSKLPTPKEFAARAERWRPYRSIASWYLWRMAERSRGEG